MILKYRLEKWEKALIFQVVDQNMGILNGNCLFPVRDGEIVIRCESGVKPSINKYYIYLRAIGDVCCKDCVSTMDFDTNDARNEHYNKIQEAMRMLKDKYNPGIKQEGTVFVI
jgi:hypothetical protein